MKKTTEKNMFSMQESQKNSKLEAMTYAKDL